MDIWRTAAGGQIDLAHWARDNHLADIQSCLQEIKERHKRFTPIQFYAEVKLLSEFMFSLVMF